VYISIFFFKTTIFKFSAHKLPNCVVHRPMQARRGGAPRYSCNPSEEGWWSAPRPGRFTPGKTLYPLYRRPGSVAELLRTSTENLATTGIRSSNRSAHSKTLFRRVDSHKVGRHGEPSTVCARNLITFEFIFFFQRCA
jgi:hypothetical protein